VYKRQIYQIAESISSCRIESKKNRFGSENRIETFFARIGMLYAAPRLTFRDFARIGLSVEKQAASARRRRHVM